MQHYGFTIVACAIVGVLAMAMAGAASQPELPPPVVLYDSSREPAAASAPTPRAGDHRADSPSREPGHSQRGATSTRRHAAAAAGGGTHRAVGGDDSTVERAEDDDLAEPGDD